jgi:hypothetical protein
MKTSKINLGLFILITLAAINCLVINASAQPRDCKPQADSIYFTDPGTDGPPVRGVHPGGTGYDLHIMGYEAYDFDVIREKYMAGLSLTVWGNYFATWHVDFAANAARDIPSIQMKNKCPALAGGGGTRFYNLDANVRLFNN